MPQKKHFTSYLLLLLFGFLFLKNLLPNIIDHNHNNHDEFGHIHFHTKIAQKSVDHLENTSSRKQTEKDKNCSSGKSVFAYSHYPSEIYKITVPNLVEAFDLIFTVTNNFKTPYLDPIRKPPRLA